jgi:uncharacterized membrane protein YdjX (TVP38/TMEM64 family)
MAEDYRFWAFPLTYISIVFASVLAFLAARYLLRDKIRSLLKRHPKYRTLDKAVADNGWQVVVLMRLSPVVPFNLQNYALGVTGIPFLQYLTATLIGLVPRIAIHVYFGIFGKGLGNGTTIFDWILFGFPGDHRPGDLSGSQDQDQVCTTKVRLEDT